MDIKSLVDNQEHLQSILDFLAAYFANNPLAWQLFQKSVEVKREGNNGNAKLG